MKGKFACLWAAFLCLLLSGCTLANFWLSDCGGVDVDLVVTNNSSIAVGSIALDYGNQTEVISNADGSALLKQGEVFGLEVAEGAEQVVVILADMNQKELARCLIEWNGDRLYLILDRDGTLSWSEEG